MVAIITGITQWKNCDDLVSCKNWSQDIKDAFGEQTNIGWEAMIQAQYYAQLKRRQTGKSFVSSLIKKLCDDSWDFWQHCNHYLHRPDTIARVLLIWQLSSHIAA
eukprot:1964610-Ditylum_brightwellii.AAC.1